MSEGPFKTDRRDALLIMTGAAMTPLLPPLAAHAAQADFGPGRGLEFDLGWRFFKGAGAGFEASAFDDAGWRPVDLPHDWSIEDLPDQAPPNRIGPFDAKAVGGGNAGFVEGGGAGIVSASASRPLPAPGARSISTASTPSAKCG